MKSPFLKHADRLQKQLNTDFIGKKSVYALKPEHIQIFGDCAMLTASFTYKPEAENYIYIIDMPLDYAEDSVSVEAEGIRYDSIGHFSYNAADLECDEKNKADLRRKAELLECRMENLKSFMKSRSERADSIEEFQKIQDAGENEYIKLQSERNKIKKELDRSNSEISDQEIRYGFRIHLTGSERRECRVFIKYIVYEVYWDPVCTLNALTKEGKIRLESRARICSSLKLDSVPAILTTGAAKLWGSPVLNNYIVKRESVPNAVSDPFHGGLFTKSKISSRFGAGSPIGLGFKSDRDDDFEEDLDDEMFDDSAEAGLFDVTGFKSPNAAAGSFSSREDTVSQSRDYIINEPFSSQGKDDVQDIVLEQALLDAETGYLVIPSVSTGAFLMMHAEGIREEYEKLMGKGALENDLSISMDGRLLRSEPAEKIFKNSDIVFERINGISAQRVLLESKKDKISFGKKMIINESYRITVENKLDTQAAVLIRDNIPVTTETEIEIRRIEDAGADLDPETGCASWKKTLAPQGKYSFDVKYSIVYPADMNISIQR